MSVTNITQPTVTNQSSSLTPASGAGIDYAVWAASTNAAVGTGNNPTTGNAQVGDIGTTGQVRRSVFGFDLEDTVMPAQLTAATLKLYYRGALGNATTAGGAVSLYHGSTLSIASGASGTQLQATFGLANWTDTGLNVIESPSAAQGYYSVNVTSQVLADLTGDPARAADVMSHFLIRWDKEGTTNAYLTFDALEGTSGDPVLELTLAPAPVEGTSGQQFSTWADAVGGLTGYAPNEPGPTNPWPLLTEYALGTDPTTLTLGLIPATPTNATEQLGTYQLQSLVVSNATNVYLTLQHNFNREADDIEIAFRESSNLVSWVEPLVLTPPYDGSSSNRSLVGPGSLATHPNVVTVVTNAAGTNSLVATARITVRSSKPVASQTAGYFTLAVRPTVAAASAPTQLRATDHAGVLLEWNGSLEQGVFVIERSPAGMGAFVTVGQSDITQFTDTTATIGQTYDYRIRAVNAAGASAWSNLATATRFD